MEVREEKRIRIFILLRMLIIGLGRRRIIGVMMSQLKEKNDEEGSNILNRLFIIFI